MTTPTPPTPPPTGRKSLFYVPKTLDEILVAATFVVWPLIFLFVLLPNMDLSTAGNVGAWIIAIAIEVGVAFAMKTARQGAQHDANLQQDAP